MDEETVKAVQRIVNDAAAEHDITVTELIVFGSRARDDYRERSDVDILIVSPDFTDTPYYQRPRPFARDWPYGELPTPEFICLTPKEFDERKDKQPNLIRTAVEEGVSLA